MRNVTVVRTVAAPRSSVWAVLADYPNIVDWNDGITNSYAIGEATEGVGAQRQCELAPNGKMSMREIFTLAEIGDTTPGTMSYDYEPKIVEVLRLGPR